MAKEEVQVVFLKNIIDEEEYWPVYVGAPDSYLPKDIVLKLLVYCRNRHLLQTIWGTEEDVVTFIQRGRLGDNSTPNPPGFSPENLLFLRICSAGETLPVNAIYTLYSTTASSPGTNIPKLKDIWDAIDKYNRQVPGSPLAVVGLPGKKAAVASYIYIDPAKVNDTLVWHDILELYGGLIKLIELELKPKQIKKLKECADLVTLPANSEKDIFLMNAHQQLTVSQEVLEVYQRNCRKLKLSEELSAVDVEVEYSAQLQGTQEELFSQLRPANFSDSSIISELRIVDGGDFFGSEIGDLSILSRGAELQLWDEDFNGDVNTWGRTTQPVSTINLFLNETGMNSSGLTTGGASVLGILTGSNTPVSNLIREGFWSRSFPSLASGSVASKFTVSSSSVKKGIADSGAFLHRGFPTGIPTIPDSYMRAATGILVSQQSNTTQVRQILANTVYDYTAPAAGVALPESAVKVLDRFVMDVIKDPANVQVAYQHATAQLAALSLTPEQYQAVRQRLVEVAQVLIGSSPPTQDRGITPGEFKALMPAISEMSAFTSLGLDTVGALGVPVVRGGVLPRALSRETANLGGDGAVQPLGASDFSATAGLIQGSDAGEGPAAIFPGRGSMGTDAGSGILPAIKNLSGADSLIPPPLKASLSSPFDTLVSGSRGRSGSFGQPPGIPGAGQGQKVVVNYGPESFVFNVERKLSPQEIGVKALAYLAKYSNNKAVADIMERIEHARN